MKLKIVASGSFLKLSVFWLHCFNNWQKCTWQLNGCHGQSDFINVNIFETLKDSPKTPPSLKFLEQMIHMLVEGVH